VLEFAKPTVGLPNTERRAVTGTIGPDNIVGPTEQGLAPVSSTS
jgi:hypothetical protein